MAEYSAAPLAASAATTSARAPSPAASSQTALRAPAAETRCIARANVPYSANSKASFRPVSACTSL